MSLIERQKRMGLHLPVEVRGEDGGGVRFTEHTRSVNVSGGGICFESHRHIAVGARLHLSIELPFPPTALGTDVFKAGGGLPGGALRARCRARSCSARFRPEEMA
jgi:hypothetical protein